MVPTPPGPAGDSVDPGPVAPVVNPRPRMSTPQPLPDERGDPYLLEVRRRVVEPIVRSVLSDDEFHSARVFRPDRVGSVWVAVIGGGDGFEWFLTSDQLAAEDQTMDAIAARFASDIEDWVCETRFGWGQQRRAVYTVPPPTGSNPL